MNIIIVLLLLILTQTSIVNRIDDNSPTIFDTNTTIISTLGQFRAYLLTNNCTIQIEKYNPKTGRYHFHGICLPETYLHGSCNTLAAKNGTIINDRGQIYTSLPRKDYLETALIIDDEGILRLQGVGKDKSNSSRDLFA